MSNILAAIGRGQLRVLDDRVDARRRIFAYYKEALGNIPGIEFMPEAPYGRSNRWLTVILITPEGFGNDRETVQLALETENIVRHGQCGSQCTCNQSSGLKLKAES